MADDWGNEKAATGSVWLTRDECIDKHSFDPTGYPEAVIKSKLIGTGGGRFQRVWSEDAVLAMKEP